MTIVWIAIAVVADAVLAPDLRVFGARLELAVAGLCFLSAKGPDRIVCAWLLGLWRDCFSVGPFGVYAIPFLGLAIFHESMRSRWFVDNLPTRAALMFVSIASVCVFAALLSGANLFTLAWTSVASAVYTTMVVSGGIELGRIWGSFGSRLSRA